MQYLERNDVHIWSVQFNQDKHIVPNLYELLTFEDLRKAAAYRFESHRMRYLITRGFLRDVLAKYAGSQPGNLYFKCNSYGKPYLLGHEELQFNLAHSDSIAILVVSRHKAVGADVERLRYDIEIDAIVEKYFSQEEIKIYQLIPDEWKNRAFFEVWTCKEAIVKAAGFGLYYPLDNFSVNIGQGSITRLVGTKKLPYPESEWGIRQINPAPGYIGAIAVQETEEKIRFKEFEYKLDRVIYSIQEIGSMKWIEISSPIQ